MTDTSSGLTAKARRFLASRAAAKDQEMISGKLKAGRNRLLVKAIQEAADGRLIRLLDARKTTGQC